MIYSDRQPENGGRDGPSANLVDAEHDEGHIAALRQNIDEIDEILIDHLQRRARLSAEVQRTRVAHGGSSLVPAREEAVRDHFRHGLGEHGGRMADAVLHLCRGMPSAASAEKRVPPVSGGRS